MRVLMILKSGRCRDSVTVLDAYDFVISVFDLTFDLIVMEFFFFFLGIYYYITVRSFEARARKGQ